MKSIIIIAIAFVLLIPTLVFAQSVDPPKPTEASPELRADMAPPSEAVELLSYDDEIMILSVYIEKPSKLTIKGKYIQLPSSENYDTIPSYSDSLRYSIPIRIDHNYDDENFNMGVAQNGMFGFTKQLVVENKDKPFEITVFHKAKWTQKVDPFILSNIVFPEPEDIPSDELISNQESKIPDWLRNNAGWWADGQIDDDSFVQALEYLITHEVLKIEKGYDADSSSFVDCSSYRIIQNENIYKNSINIMNTDLIEKFDVYKTYSSEKYQELVEHYGEIHHDSILKFMESNDYLYSCGIERTPPRLLFTDQRAFDVFHYGVTSNSPAPESTDIPKWIKNNAAWWAAGEIDDEAFVAGIQFLIKEGVITV